MTTDFTRERHEDNKQLQSNDASLLETVYAKDRYPVAYASYMSKKKANDALLTYNMQN